MYASKSLLLCGVSRENAASPDIKSCERGGTRWNKLFIVARARCLCTLSCEISVSHAWTCYDKSIIHSHKQHHTTITSTYFHRLEYPYRVVNQMFIITNITNIVEKYLDAKRSTRMIASKKWSENKRLQCNLAAPTHSESAPPSSSVSISTGSSS